MTGIFSEDNQINDEEITDLEEKSNEESEEEEEEEIDQSDHEANKINDEIVLVKAKMNKSKNYYL